jgi:hypothetical protein
MILVATGALVSLVFGFVSPRKAGWFVLYLFPLLGSIGFTIVSSNLIPLTFTRVAILITVGMAMKNHGNVALRYITRIRYVQIMSIFVLLLVMSSLRDQFIYHIIISHIPNLFLSIALCFMLIRDKSDLMKMVKIFIWQAAFISLFIVIEYYSDFSLGLELARTNPNFSGNIYAKSEEFITRGGYYRAMGIDGSAIHTGYKLAFLFPLVLWYATQKLNAMVRVIPVFLTSIGLLFLQTRAAIFAIVLAVGVLVLGLIYIRDERIVVGRKNLKNILLLILIATIITSILIPEVRDQWISFYNKILLSTIIGLDASTAMKIDRVPLAMQLISDHPFLGYGSTEYVYNTLMNSADLPAPFIYFLSGGIVMVSMYLYLIIYMPYSVYKLSRSKSINGDEMLLLQYISVALLAGILCVFSNTIESHFWMMYMLYMGTIKIYIVLPQLRKQIL